MFTIRNRQIEAMAAAMRDRSHGELLNYLRREYPEAIEDVPEGELVPRCREAEAQARRYGMTWQSTIFAFVALTFVLHPDFHLHPPLQSFFQEATIAPDLRLQAAVETLDEEVWAAAAEPAALRDAG